MRILIDLGHPAHIHYFRNFIKIMQSKGHEFNIVSRDKEVLQILLLNYNIEFTNRGRGKKTLFGKIFYIFYADFIIYKTAKKFKPDLFLSFASTYLAHVSRLYGKPHIVLDDTEHSKFELMMYPPFSDVILNPSVFWKKFSQKQLFFESYMELFYLHPKYFTPDISILNSYGISSDQIFFLFRFVSWNASHDIGQKGLSAHSKVKLIKTLKRYGRVLISSERQLPEELKSYHLDIKPEHLHHFLAFATLAISEGSTTASECAVLGTPNIYINTLVVSNCKEQEEKYGLCFHLTNENDVLEKVFDLINNKNLYHEFRTRRERLLKDKIDGTAFLTWFIENYPQSEKLLRMNPDYQYNFK
jgi:uncharacterized protein